MNWVRRMLVGMAVSVPLAGAAMGQNYPNTNVRLIVPFPAAGATDITARLIANQLSKQWGQTIIVENRTGASGVIGSEAVARAPADGYTLLLGTLAANVMTHLLRDKVPYGRDAFVPITILGTTPNLLMASSAVPAKTLKELIDYAKAHPGKMRYGSSGIGLSGHLGVALFAQEAKIDLIHVPYRGSAPSGEAFARGEVELTLALVPEAANTLKNSPGAKPIAIAADKRSDKFPDTPTFAELGYPNVQVYALSGLMAPKGTPQAIVDKIYNDTVIALKDPALVERMNSLGIDIVGSTPAEFDKLLKTEFTRWEPLIRTNDIKAE
ncbi:MULTISPECIES: tripartite tricarboxylate transporter substrate binding protein [unclassified Beijerinckia]|uniref:Bug family tripartite tricarboxylate transporter substrate binding protein n=1 Tax=unclassified Beijerinckia TaxID=2638183 RepID=UPI0008961CBB|nr:MULTISPECIES: tripartite tricarboxylate transporter substrate binding protein [unclassified Beijerinckia]MDH7798411.1 tripartite-type tricarboxylate transporter receptor subunit TctC [Beijerinckia sp. GAS462]SED19994.1 Tripartite-type tricarboxylate transporter, receptor component TctC [Beijerinckia sp. 28-YEA-48]